MRAHRESRRQRRLFSFGLGASTLLLAVGCGRSVDAPGSGGAGGAVTTTNVSTANGSGSKAGATTAVTSSVTTMSGVLDVSSSSGGPTCSGFGDACTQCESASCSAVWCGCKNDPECLGVLQCWGMCAPGDQACIHACVLAHQAGVSEALLVNDCAATACDTSCNFGKPETPCTVCLLSNCSMAMNACFADTECLPLYQCLSACPPANLTCQQGCYAAHGTGVSMLQAVLDCSMVQCSQICAN